MQTKVVLEEENEPDLTEGPSERLRVRRLGETGSLRLEVAKSVTSIRGAPKRKRKLQSTTTVRGRSSILDDASSGLVAAMLDFLLDYSARVGNISEMFDANKISYVC